MGAAIVECGGIVVGGYQHISVGSYGKSGDIGIVRIGQFLFFQRLRRKPYQQVSVGQINSCFIRLQHKGVLGFQTAYIGSRLCIDDSKFRRAVSPGGIGKIRAAEPAGKFRIIRLFIENHVVFRILQIKNIQSAIGKACRQQRSRRVQGKHPVFRVRKNVIGRGGQLFAVKRAFSQQHSIFCAVDLRPVRRPVCRRRHRSISGQRQRNRRLPAPDLLPILKVIDRNSRIPGVNHPGIIDKQTIRHRGILYGQLHRRLPAFSFPYRRFSGIYRRQVRARRRQRNSKRSRRQLRRIQRLKPVRQVIHSQRLRQRPLGLGRIRRIQKAPFLRQRLHGVGHRQVQVAGFQRVGGILRQLQPVLFRLHPLQSREGAGGSRQNPAQKQRGYAGPYPFQPLQPGIPLMQMGKIIQHRVRRLIPQIRVGIHGLCNDIHNQRTELFFRQRLYLSGVAGRPPAAEQVVQCGAGAVDIRPHVRHNHLFRRTERSGRSAGHARRSRHGDGLHQSPLQRHFRFLSGFHFCLRDQDLVLLPHRLPRRRKIQPVVLRRRVTGAAADDVFLSQSQGDVKVDETDIPVPGAHQVGRLNVAVDKSSGRIAMGGAVQVRQRLQQLYGPLDHLGLGKTLPPLQRLVQAFAFNIVHSRIHRFVFHEEIVDSRYIRVIQFF